jgi:hypothetical protein
LTIFNKKVNSLKKVYFYFLFLEKMLESYKINSDNLDTKNLDTNNKIYLNLSYYSTILDESSIDLKQLKDNISNIFTEKFDSFFSDLYPAEID